MADKRYDGMRALRRDGLYLAAQYSYITNCLGYCGPQEGSKHFLEFLKKSENDSKTNSESYCESSKLVLQYLKKFEAFYPYLQLIAEKFGKDSFDYDVVEAYWTGNELLDSFTAEDMKKHVQNLVNRGLPKSMGDKLIANMPLGAIPFHAFHVMYVGVGNVTGHVETTLQNMDRCRISIGRIVQIIDDKLIVNTDTLKGKNGKLYLQSGETKTAVFLPDVLHVKIGDYVSMHWGFACKKLSSDEVHNLVKYNNRALFSANGL